MIKYCLDKWNKNQKNLKNVLAKDAKLYDCEYSYLVKLVIEHIFNGRDNDYEEYKWDANNITMIDNGDYQGTLLFLIPRDTYQPSEYEYLMTYIGYGSCSGCDTLQHIQMFTNYNELPSKEVVKDFMLLCKDIVCNTIRPFNCGWRSEEIFNTVEGDSDA